MSWDLAAAEEGVATAVGDWIVLVTSATVVRAPYDAEQQDRTFITFTMGDVLAVGQDAERLTETEVDGEENGFVYEVKGSREVPVSVQAFGEGCATLLEKLRIAMSLPSLRDAAMDAGIVPFGMSAVRNLTELLDTDHDPRALLEMRVRFTVTTSETQFASLRVTGTLEVGEASATSETEDGE